MFNDIRNLVYFGFNEASHFFEANVVYINNIQQGESVSQYLTFFHNKTPASGCPLLLTQAGHFSCDWENWGNKMFYFKVHLYYDLSNEDMKMKCVYGLTPPKRPHNKDHQYIFESD